MYVYGRCFVQCHRAPYVNSVDSVVPTEALCTLMHT